VVRLVTVGWTSNGARLDFLEDGIDHSKTVLGVTINSKEVVDNRRSNADPLDSQATILDFQIVNTETSRVQDIPGVGIWAVHATDSWSTDASWVVFALGVGPVFADLSVVAVSTWNNDVFSDTLSDYGFFFDLEDAAFMNVNVSEVKLKSGSDTPLHVLGPDWNVLVQDDSLDMATFNLDSKRLGQWLQLSKSLSLKLGQWVHLPFSVVQTKLDVVKLDIQHTGTSLNMEFSSEVDSRCKADIVLGTSDQRGRVTVNVFLSGLKKGCANISLYESRAAEHKAQKDEVLHDWKNLKRSG